MIFRRFCGVTHFPTMKSLYLFLNRSAKPPLSEATNRSVDHQPWGKLTGGYGEVLTPTYPWSILQAWKEFLHVGWGFWGYVPGVCWKFLLTNGLFLYRTWTFFELDHPDPGPWQFECISWPMCLPTYHVHCDFFKPKPQSFQELTSR